MAKEGKTDKVGTKKQAPGDKDFQASGVEGKKAADAEDNGVITGEHVLETMRAQGKKV